MVSTMRRLPAISAGPMSTSPRGRRALSLLDLSDLSAIVCYIEVGRLVSSRPRQRQGNTKGHRTNGPHIGSALRHRPQRSRILLDAVHGKPRLQEGAAPD